MLTAPANTRSAVMRRLVGWFLLLLLGLVPALASTAENRQRVALLLDIDGAIGPATSDYVLRGLEQARDQGAELVILRMDTPGGLDASMREMIKKILASPVPVASYVAPSGSRAASAGTYILYASHIAAMAPATNLGSATPVQIGGVPSLPDKLPAPDEPGADKAARDKSATDNQSPDEPVSNEPPAQPSSETPSVDSEQPATEPRRGKTPMERKVLEDAVAYIQGLAERHGRNGEWAEAAVREGANLTASEALERNVIDLVAGSVGELLEQIHGHTVKMDSGKRVLDTQNLQLVEVAPDWRSQLLSVITNPNVAYILMMIGIYGIIFELANPGAIFPGVVGAICLVLALYAFQLLPINYAGLALIMLGIFLMVAEAFAPSFGILGIGGIAAFVVGSIILVDEATLSVSIPLIGGTALVSAAFFIWVLSRLLTIRRHQVVTGQEEMIGMQGTVLDDFSANRGRVWLHSESWQAESSSNLAKDTNVRVTGINGLRLQVEPLSEHNSKGDAP